MWNFQRIICIWICCVSCMFGTTQLSSLVQAVPYEYFDDHEQSFYDLDTEQIQAKYDARLLSQQMLQTEQQQQQHLENLKSLHSAVGVGRGAENRKSNDGGSSYMSTATTKLKSNDGHTLDVGIDDDDDDERNDWLEDTSTIAAASTSAITATLDEIYLPRAASCFTNGQKFTHGQKVPRLDNCEVCLCMDGEIFCWWEKCDKKPTKALTTYDDYLTPSEESSTTRMQLNTKTTFKTTLKPIKKPKTNKDYKYDDDDSAEIREIQQDYEGLKDQLMRKKHEPEREQHKTHHSKQMAKKKIFRQHQREEKLNKKIKEQIKIKKNQKEQQKQHKTNEHFAQQQHHGHNHNHNNNRNSNNNYGSNGSSSKILNFPENLPSVLYYDYKTEEHHQHQHEHREQHLKHQRQKQLQQLLLQQHENELKHQQQQHQQQEQQHPHHVNHQHEYGQDYNSPIDKILSTVSEKQRGGGEGGMGATVEAAAEMPGNRAGHDETKTKLRNATDGSSTIFKYFKNGNENIFGADLQTDSDILPEPPTKKPKFLTSIADKNTTNDTAEFPISQIYQLSTTTTAGTITKSTTSTRALTNTPSMAMKPAKKQIFSTWDYNEKSVDKTSDDGNINSNGSSNNNNESSEDTIDTDDQDDAFHRWLTSTETNNKNNFTLNDAIIGRDDGGLDAAAAAATAGGSGSDDYNGENRNYENIDLEADKGFSTTKTKIKSTIRPLTMTEMATKMAPNDFVMALEGDGGTIYYEKIRKPKYERNLSDNNSYNSNGNLTNNNGIINSNNNNISSFGSNAYQNYNNMDRPTSSSSSSSTSNEDNGVGSVVNIDIMLTASSADLQQPQSQQRNIETTNQHRQLQLHGFEHEEQIAKTQLKFIQPPVLISNTNDVDKSNPLYSIMNNNTRHVVSNSSHDNVTNIVADGLNMEEGEHRPKVSAKLSSISSNLNNNRSSNHSLSSGNVDFNFSHVSSLMPPSNATSATAVVVATTAATSPTLSTTLNPERQCNVMGTLYKIGDVLPQDTGNCLQCICIDGSTSDDTPRVTCSPHNCPPLVLPDLFDATGY